MTGGTASQVTSVARAKAGRNAKSPMSARRRDLRRRHSLRLVVLDRPSQALAQADLRLIAERLSRPRTIGPGVRHLAGTGRRVLGFDVGAEQLAQLVEELVEGGALAVCDVERLARHPLCVHGLHV